MSTDTDRVVNFTSSFHEFWSLPFQVAVCLYLLYQQVSFPSVSLTITANIEVNKHTKEIFLGKYYIVNKWYSKVAHCPYVSSLKFALALGKCRILLKVFYYLLSILFS